MSTSAGLAEAEAFLSSVGCPERSTTGRMASENAVTKYPTQSIIFKFHAQNCEDGTQMFEIVSGKSFSGGLFS